MGNLDPYAGAYDAYQTDEWAPPNPSLWLHHQRALWQQPYPSVLNLDAHYGVQPQPAHWVPLGRYGDLEAPYPVERNYPFVKPNQLSGLASGAQYANLRAPSAYDGY